MALYRYEAVDKTGKVVRGVMNACDEQQVAQNLTAMGYTARGVYGSSGAATASAPPAVAPQTQATQRPLGMQSVTLASGVPVSIKSSVPPASLAGFFRHLATLVKSGYPIGQALSEMRAVTRNGRLRNVLPQMQESTQGGRSLSSLMAERPGVFPVHTTASVWCGELSGRLEIALEEIATDLEQEASDTRYSKIGWGLMKINLITLVLLIPMANLTALLMPTLKAAMDKAGEMSRAEVLRRLLGTYVSDMLWKSIIAMAVLVVIWMVWGVIKRVPSAKRLLDGALIVMPVWGRLHRERALARFLHVLDGLTAAGVNSFAAWDAASLTPRNSYIAERLRRAKAQVQPNASLSEMLSAAGVFDPEDVAAAASGEKAGRVPEVLAARSAAYSDSALARKTAAKAIAGALFTVSSLILGGYVLVQLWSSYVDLAFKAADAMGK